MDNWSNHLRMNIRRCKDYEIRKEKLLKVILQHLNRTNKVSLLYTTALDLCYIKVALEREAGAIKEVLNLAAKAIETCFLFASHKAVEAQFVYDGAIIIINKNEKFNPINYTQADDFVNAIYLAILVDNGGLHQLASIGMEELPSSPNKTATFFQDYVHFLKSVIVRDRKAGDWLTKTFKGPFPDQLKYGIPEYLEHNPVEHLKVWIALLGKDIQAFNNALQTALQKHQFYWCQKQAYFKGGLPPNEAEEGCFSLALTAICKLAQQNGTLIEVKSDYLPGFLIKS